MTLDDYIILPNTEIADQILLDWHWLIGENKKIIFLTKAGDLLLEDYNENLYFLDVGQGITRPLEIKLSDLNYNEFNSKLLDEILLPELVEKLESKYGPLEKTKIFSYTKTPILGGEYDDNNMFPLDILEHYGLLSLIHQKIKDLPDGTEIIIEYEK